MNERPVGKKRVRFEPDNIEVMAETGANLLRVAQDAGVYIASSCGGNAVCGTCKVLIKEGNVATTGLDNHLSPEEIRQGYRHACSSHVLTDLTVFIPVESRLERTALTREDADAFEISDGVMGFIAEMGRNQEASPATAIESEMAPADVALEPPRTRPPLAKFFLKMTPPTLEDNVSDLSRILRELKSLYNLINLTVDFDVVKKLPETLRAANWEVTVTTIVTAISPSRAARHRPRVINIEPGDTRDRYYSLAFDIGTTSICGQLLDLNQRKVMAQYTDYNRQIIYGQDVITRIAFSQKTGGLDKLQQAVVSTINGIIRVLLSQCRIALEDVGHFVVAGNTTMIQILFGVSPKYIRLAPYVPTVNFMPPVKAKSLGIEAADHVYIHSLPIVASYIGADIVSGVLASGMHEKETLTLYIDIGTNGQIVLGNSEWMVTAACSAGPAFEGGGITNGMIASGGAIESFEINKETGAPVVRTVNGERPKGICGSGLISIIAGLFKVGIIGQDGKFDMEKNNIRLREGQDGPEYVIAWAPETQTGRDIVITEIDTGNLLRAKAAMYAGFQTLAKSVGVDGRDLEQVIIAGNFGHFIDPEEAITIGLLPDLPVERFTFIGNGSLNGVRLNSYYTDIIDDARKVATMMTNFELSDNTDFTNNYIASLFLPHTQASEFPSVMKWLNGMKVRK
jgi:uncharacterized 2Fe-2S/4Fe-4S cluster protein (DUF4445 family)